jgi:hypothetical protein
VLKTNFFNRRIWLFIISCCVLTITAQGSCATNDDDSSKDSENSDKNRSPISDQDLGINNTEAVLGSIDGGNSPQNALQKNKKVTLIIHINVRQNKNANDWCRIYPYPVAPPKKKSNPNPLPTKDKALRPLILSMSYWTKTRAEKPYPSGGWRMQIALQNAINKSGLGVPHIIFTEYPWIDNILPYVRKEVLTTNKREENRITRFNTAQAVFNEYRADIEVQSFNKGLFPIDVPILRERGGYRKGRVVVDKANWWIVAMHKIAGLKYYWLWPVKLNDNAEQLVTLNADNAIYVEGSW